MNRTFLLAACACFTLIVGIESTAFAATATDRNGISDAIKAQVRDIVTGINTHNADLATSHDAPNVLVVEQSQPNTVGVAADVAGFRQAMAAEPNWRVSLVEEAVDVSESGDMAVYRSIYNQDSSHGNVPLTQKVNFISGWSRHENGTWMMDWYVVSEMEKSHNK
ncbi:MAG TPA: nuclear transport factor 2 family protein [Rhizomicrobium sp.]|jgi:ketosteroid isomerase-like protein|nr:nuclear transport factor 2 family protein [Rhizomicrobium sp.]